MNEFVDGVLNVKHLAGLCEALRVLVQKDHIRLYHGLWLCADHLDLSHYLHLTGDHLFTGAGLAYISEVQQQD